MSTPLPSDLLEPLKRLAEGQIDPDGWLAWWDENQARVEAAVSRGAFLRLRPRAERTAGPSFAVIPSVQGVRYLLDLLKVPYASSDRYERAGEEEFRAWSAARKAQEAARKRELQPVLKAMEAGFPKLSRFLARHLDRIETAAPGATEVELAELEAVLGAPLPGEYRRWLAGVRTLDLETLVFGPEHPFVVRAPKRELPAEGLLCIADYALEADGDQVLLDPREVGDDPPVFYYGHEVPEVRRLTSSFTAWIESLPKSPALRDD